MTAAPAMRLYEATDALDVVREWIYEHDEEIRAMEGALPDELAQLLEQAEGDFKTKAERVGLFIRELVVNAKAVKEEEVRLASRVKHYERAADGLKRYLQSQMEQAGIPKVEGKLCTVRLQKNSPAVHAPDMTQEALGRIRAEFVIVIPASYRLNTAAILQHWKATGENPVEGVEVTQGRHLRIA
jgi:hypothetical protein